MNSNFSRLRDSFREKASKASAGASPTTPVATSDYWSSAKSELAPMMLRPNKQKQQQQQQQQPQQQQQSRNEHKLDESPTSTLMMMTGSDQDYYLDVAAASFQQRQHLAPLDTQLKQTHQQQVFGAQMASQEFAFSADLDDYDDYAVPSDESCCRLDRSQVELVQLIGEGQKGYVFLGKLQSKDGQSIIDVAIKTLKFETDQLIERLMNEAAMMKQLEHPHIIKFIGMCPETPALIAMELAQFGEIKLYLRLNQRFIKCSQLVLFSFQISTALSYLESKNYVHRDVAARNVLVCSHSCVKLADFGLSRNLQPNFLYNATSGAHPQNASTAELLNPGQHQNLYVAAPRVKLPVRWLAPESLVFRRFTSASDVWMFAVCTWEFFQFGQMRPWAHLRNNQVLAAIEVGQRLPRPEACPERLYQLMLRSWNYAPVQRPKFREIKQCIWSIYLSERTREQLDLERLERDRQHRLMMMHQQQQQLAGQQIQVPLLVTNEHANSNQQHHHHHHHTDQSAITCDRSRGGGDATQKAASSGSSPNVMLPVGGGQQVAHHQTPSSNYSSTLTTTTNDNEQSISPCSSAFNSMGRTAKEQQHQATRNSALRTQISRFEQRQAHSPNGNNNNRPHLLQKQRSQGAIGMSTTSGFEAHGDPSSRKQGRVGAMMATRRSNQMQPLDDQALEHVKRGLRRCQTNERQSVAAMHNLDDSGSEADEADDDDDGRDEDSAWTPSHRFISASPALTTDTGPQSRLVSMEPAYEGVFVANSKQAKGSARPNDQVAMLRANFDPSDRSRLSPSIGPLLTSSPALTSSNSPTRPASWRSTPTAADRNNNIGSNQAAGAQQRPASRVSGGKKPQPNQPEQQVAQHPDQLGAMLQALRITPMKAKLRSSPEQSVRVLQREEMRPMVREEPKQVADGRLHAPLVAQRGQSVARQDQVPEQEGHLKQLMIHRRLLGRIRPNSSSPSPSLSGDISQEQKRDGATKGTRPKSQVVMDKNEEQLVGANVGRSDINRRLPHQNKSVEAVDHSLQILESLMSSGEPEQPRSLERRVKSAATTSLPRRSHR